MDTLLFFVGLACLVGAVSSLNELRRRERIDRAREHTVGPPFGRNRTLVNRVAILSVAAIGAFGVLTCSSIVR
jgi:hypothetical protein